MITQPSCEQNPVVITDVINLSSSLEAEEVYFLLDSASLLIGRITL